MSQVHPILGPGMRVWSSRPVGRCQRKALKGLAFMPLV